MKKLILTFGLTLLAAGSFSQVILHVEAPVSLVGNYPVGTPPDWGSDLTDQDNSVIGTVMMADDSLACDPLTNNLTGKIALVFRGDCEFGSKALAAQNAGAIGVLIVNNQPGAPAGMLGGADGDDVNIPVIMISQADGATIYNAMQTEDVVVFLGDKNGYFANDIGFTVRDVLRADMNGTPSQLVQNSTEFTTTIGAVVRNLGHDNQTGITFTATVNNGTEIYSETSAPFDLEAGDSTEFIALPDFSLPTYPAGTYTLTYTVDYDNNADEGYDADNTVITNFKIQDTLLSYSRLDPTTGLPMSTIGTQPADNEGSYSSCIVFSNPNASRLGAMGLYFGASINAPDSLDGQEVLVSAFRWDDQFTDVEDPALAFDVLTEMFPSESYYFGENPTNGGQVYVPFPTQFVFEDNQRYMFCVQTFDMRIFFSYDEESNYDWNINQDLQPVHPIESNGNFRWAGFVGGSVPSMAVRVFDAEDLTINENVIETSVFPNPSKDVVTVKVDANGSAVLKVTDLAGRTIATQDVTITNGQFTVNVADYNAGTYLFTVAYENGASSQFNVVVAK